jgi:hypothetical protein
MRLGMWDNSSGLLRWFCWEKLGKNKVLKTRYLWHIASICIEMSNTKTSFSPNLNNKTTSVDLY